MKNEELPLQDTCTALFDSVFVILYNLWDLTFYYYLIKILPYSLGVLKSFPIFAMLFIDILLE